jgi:hypothetical protein
MIKLRNLTGCKIYGYSCGWIKTDTNFSLKVDFHQRDLCRATKSRDVTCFHLHHLSRNVTC